jgi:hypothetical protein
MTLNDKETLPGHSSLGRDSQIVKIILELRILVLLLVSTLTYEVKVKNYS